MKEVQFQTKVERWLKSQEYWFVKYWGGGAFTKAGVPDLLCCIEGRFVGLELKTQTGHVKELQKYNIEQICNSGGVAMVLRPADFEDFKKEVRTWKKLNAS